MARKYTLKIEYIKKRYEVAIATITATIAMPLILGSDITTFSIFGSYNNILSEIFKKVKSFIFCYASLAQEEIDKIFHNCFKLINLYRPYYICSYYYELLQNQEFIDIEDDMLTLKKIFEIYDDFGKLFCKVELENFHNDIIIIISLFIINIIKLNIALITFYNYVIWLFQVYNGQKAIFSLAIEVYIHIISFQFYDYIK